MKRILLTLAGVSVLLFAACRKEAKLHQTGSLTVKLTDAPAAYDSVWVDIQRVEIHLVSDQDGGKWISVPTNSGVYDLLQLQNGIDTTLADIDSLAEGKITQMRLILGNNNSLYTNGSWEPMTVPSGSQSGIKLVGNIEVQANQNLVVKLDFDANQSVVLNGNGDYHLKPVIKVLD
ncbi:MAG: DUF4382 domain-containing protein [Flavobacteriales bacterium]|nr:DUF4382 domain-containing protein [Flavobacteriales bacterium]MCB9446742.1 DUF4382 domain-containing protein [Flavobacteriales bacterium]